MSNGTNLKVNDISKFKKSSNQFIEFLNTSEVSITFQKGSDDYSVNIRNDIQPFEVGDIVMYQNNIGIVMGLTPDGSVIVDKNKIVSDAEPASIYDIEAYRNDLIPYVDGISYVEMTNTARRTTKFVVADQMAPYTFFKNICEFHNVPIDSGDINSAGGIGYDYSITLVNN